jgi:regulator of cell morphogenesis and NO signaling
MEEVTLEEGTLGAALEREHREIDEGIAAYTASVAAGSGDTAPLTRAIAGLRRHIYLEEEFLFPSMRAQLAIPMMVMLREHGELWETLEVLEGKLAAGGGDIALEICGVLTTQLDAHNSKEEPIFYTQVDTTLTPAASTEFKAYLESAELPDGWRCERARG